METDTKEEPRVEQMDGAAAHPDTSHVGVGVYARPKRPPLWYSVRGGILIALLASLIFGTRFVAAYIGAGDTLSIHVEQQQPVTIDLRSATPRSPYIFGMNVFPASGTQSVDGAPGFMSYDASTVKGLTGAGIRMLRFPGGTWGEEHNPSYAQINAFLRLAQQTHATPMIQVRLTGGSPEQAAAMVSYCNNPHDPNRANNPGVPFVPVHYWEIGNEPDLIGKNYTVADYVRDFIAYATAMKAVDPLIQIMGPEISQYEGPDAPVDATGTPWLSGFLQQIDAYEHQHAVRLLDAVSVHRYPFGVASRTSPDLLFASPEEWRYAIPLLRAQIRQTMGADLPIAITEINTSVLGSSLASPLATSLWWADTLGTLLEERVRYADFFAARGLDQPYNLLHMNGDITPLYRVMELYTRMAPDVIQVGTTSGPVSVYVATNTSRDKLTLMFINKSPASAAVTVAPQEMFSHWSSVRFSVPPYAAACITLHRNGGRGQMAVYGPTPKMLANGQAGIISVTSLP